MGVLGRCCSLLGYVPANEAAAKTGVSTANTSKSRPLKTPLELTLSRGFAALSLYRQPPRVGMPVLVLPWATNSVKKRNWGRAVRGDSSKPISLERPLFGQCARQVAPIRTADIEAALAEQQRVGGRLGKILYDLGHLSEAQIIETLQLQAKIVATATDADVGEAGLPFPCRLSVCMPAYNEADNIRGTLESAVAILPYFVKDFELVVTNDGSSDDTAQVVKEYSDECDHEIKLVNHPQNCGYGAAVTTAMRAATGDLVMLMDSDGQFSLLDLPQFLAAIQEYDVAVGYRVDRADSFVRKLNAAMWTKFISVLLKVPNRDLDCAFKVFRRSDLEQIKMDSNGASINAEIMTQCAAKGLSICELPVRHYPCYFGEQTGANLRVILKAFRELPRLVRTRKSALQQKQRQVAGTANRLSTQHGDAQTNQRITLGGLSSNGAPEPTTNGAAHAPTEPKLSICLLAACPFPANHGTSGSIREMAEAVSDRGHDVHIVTYHIGEDIDVEGPIMHRIPRWRKNSKVVIGPTFERMVSDVLLVFKALQIIRRHSPNVIHAHGYEAGIAAGICRLLTRVPVVYSGHNTMSDELASFDFIRPQWLANAFAKFLDRFVPRVGDRCVPHSDSLADFFDESGLGKRTEPVIRFGIDLNWSAKHKNRDLQLKHDLDGPVILYAGVLDKFQRIDLLLEAMTHVLKVHPDAYLLMAVTIPAEKNLLRVKKQAEELGIADRVVFTDPLDLAGVRQCLQECDVTVIPRPGAPGFPIKLLNYMSASKPCVMFASSASGLVHRQHALLVDKDTSAALAKGLLELLENEEMRQEMGKNAYDFLLEHHDRRLTAKQLCDVYFRALMDREKPLPLEPAVPTDCWEDVRRERQDVMKEAVPNKNGELLEKTYELEQQELPS